MLGSIPRLATFFQRQMQLLIDSIVEKRRQAIDENHIEEFVELIEAGKRLPPILVRRDASDIFWLVDGRHRLAALKRLGRSHVEVLITL